MRVSIHRPGQPVFLRRGAACALGGPRRRQRHAGRACEGQLQQTRLIANHHILFGKIKASSSGAVGSLRPTICSNITRSNSCARHWLGLGLGQKSVGFKPKPFDPDEEKRNDPRVADPALKEGALLTNVFNRLARSCFYEAQKNFEGMMPIGEVDETVVNRAHETMAEYERIMHRAELHSIMNLIDDFIRWGNKHWADGIKAAEAADDADARRQVLVDSFYRFARCDAS